MVAHGHEQAAERVAGHGGRRGGLAPADGAIRRLDAYDEIERPAHRAARHRDCLGQGQSDRNGVDPANDQRLALVDCCVKVGASFHRAPHLWPRTRGIWMNSQGDGIGPTGTSMSVGPSRRLNARLSAARSSVGLRARSAWAPKLSA